MANAIDSTSEGTNRLTRPPQPDPAAKFNAEKKGRSTRGSSFTKEEDEMFIKVQARVPEYAVFGRDQ